jgi:hypothetical protein
MPGNGPQLPVCLSINPSRAKILSLPFSMRYAIDSSREAALRA